MCITGADRIGSGIGIFGMSASSQLGNDSIANKGEISMARPLRFANAIVPQVPEPCPENGFFGKHFSGHGLLGKAISRLPGWAMAFTIRWLRSANAHLS